MMKPTRRPSRSRASAAPPAAFSIAWEAGRRPRSERLLGGRLEVATAHGLDPLHRLLIEGAVQGLQPGSPRPEPAGVCLLQPPDPLVPLALRAVWPSVPLAVLQIDHYLAGQCAEALGADTSLICLAGGDAPHEPLAASTSGPLVISLPDLPALDPAPTLALLPVRRDGEAGLTLELLRQARARLAPGGHLLAATNNPRDQWLRGQLERIFGNVTLATHGKTGLLYSAKKPGGRLAGSDPAAPAPAVPPAEDPARALTQDEAWRKTAEIDLWGEHLEFATRYGVFSSDGLDDGSRALLEVLAVEQPAEVPIQAVLDLGCGWGPIGILAARHWRAQRVTLIDANARAVALARINADRHLASIPLHNEVRHTIRHDVRHEGNAASLAAEIGAYDCVLTNAPYGTEFRVAELFLRAALHALKRGGRVWVVAKRNPVLVERMQQFFGNVREFSRRGYTVLMSERV